MRIKENIIGASIAFVIFAGLGIWGVSYYKKNIYSEPVILDSAAGQSTNKPIRTPTISFLEYSSESRALQTLKEYHAMFDLKVTGGGIDNFTDNDKAWDDFLTSEVFNPQKYRNIGKELASVEGLEIDMQTLVELAEIAREKRDPQALRYMHRMLHDLDIWAFPNEDTKSGDYWGVTNTVPSNNADNREEQGKYIASN